MKLQIAIDSMARGEALDFAESIEEYADIIEIGTPLIYRYGLDIIREAESRISGARLLADAKIVDAGALESRMFLESGAEIVTMLAGANHKTVTEARRTSETHQGELMIDLIDIPSREKTNRIEELSRFSCKYFCLHRPSDISNSEELFLPDPTSLPSDLKLAVAGGIDLENIDDVLEYPLEIIIVGSAITGANNPVTRARNFSRIVKEK